jgi:integrase
VVRTIELRGAEWKEFDLDAGVWTIPAERMKMREKHIVPLSKQAIALYASEPFSVFPAEHIMINEIRS